MTTPSHELAAALLRRQQSTTARLRAGLPALLEQLESLDEPSFHDGPASADGEHPPTADDDRRGPP